MGRLRHHDKLNVSLSQVLVGDPRHVLRADGQESLKVGVDKVRVARKYVEGVEAVGAAPKAADACHHAHVPPLNAVLGAGNLLVGWRMSADALYLLARRLLYLRLRVACRRGHLQRELPRYLRRPVMRPRALGNLLLVTRDLYSRELLPPLRIPARMERGASSGWNLGVVGHIR